jgi:chromatin segregation and condensation protein Rec8/ScpA/Scc1 (kleisin family)
MALTIRKPFYLRPPWNILFDFHKLEKLTPWNINIAYLLTTFLEEMEKTGQMDFRASGVALDSSALIYLMKSKLLVKLEEPPLPPKTPQDFLPPPLFLPLRHELTSTTIQHLLEVLDDVLKGEKLFRLEKTVAEPVLPTPSEIMPQLDIYLMEIEVQMEKLYSSLSERVKGTGIIEFSALIKEMTRLEAIRTFILLLFLAQNKKVNLWQDEESEEIYITIGELNIAEDGKTSLGKDSK